MADALYPTVGNHVFMWSKSIRPSFGRSVSCFASSGVVSRCCIYTSHVVLFGPNVVLCLNFPFLHAMGLAAVSYTHLRAHETPEHLVCRLLLEKKKNNNPSYYNMI
eukprot:TRINITY_DN22518_c0_g1_i1.p2 TRINITY_DN22518_c0_g1~~TRINITY_DN22518_c0_g1_i1.p2  ORF type:complete len:106 (-),score=8.61 TRINITY_DN22518_c0_g1_i1:26-343(-)